MSVKIALINTKGGVQKTTSTMYLAHAAHAKGVDVDVWDTDPQGSLIEWHKIVQEHGEKIPFPVTQIREKDILDSDSHKALTFIDTPPGIGGVLDKVIELADFVIVPTGMGQSDLHRSLKTLEILEAKPVVLLITNALLNTRSAAGLVAELEKRNLPYFDSVIYRREAIRASYGKKVDNLYGYDLVFDQLMEVIISE